MQVLHTANPFAENNFLIARLDMLSRNPDLQSKLKAEQEWDLIVCDEAHRMSARFFGGEVKYTNAISSDSSSVATAPSLLNSDAGLEVKGAGNQDVEARVAGLARCPATRSVQPTVPNSGPIRIPARRSPLEPGAARSMPLAFPDVGP